MPINVDRISSGTDPTSVQLTVAHACAGTASNGILIVTVEVSDSSASDRIISTVTHNNEACTHLITSDAGADDVHTEIWYRTNPTAGGSPNIVVTPGGSCTDLSLGAISLTGVTEAAEATYYFDGSDAAANDPDNNWDNETNADDGNVDTDVGNPTATGSNSSNEITIAGTNAPASDGTISHVMVRVYGNDGGYSDVLRTEIFTDGGQPAGESLGTVDVESGIDGWSEYISLSTPTGGWSWAKVQALESATWHESGSFAPYFSKIEIKVLTVL